MATLVLAWVFVGDSGLSDDRVRLPDNSLVSTVARSHEPTDRCMIDEVIDVRFGSEADIEARQSDVRFAPNSGHRIDVSATWANCRY
jgi:hypothetical protein